MSDIINQNTEPLFIFDMPDDETLSETISVKGEKGAKGDPTKLSQLENDEGFIDNTVDDLTNYYDKTAADTKLDEKLDKADFDDYEIPTDFFTGAETLSGSGSAIALFNTADAYFKSIKIYGDAVQDGTPTPQDPVNIETVTGTQVIAITGDGTQTYTINLDGIELCKLGDYQDYLYEFNGKWYVHKAVGKLVFDGDESFTILAGGNAGEKRFRYTSGAIKNVPNTAITTACDIYQAVTYNDSKAIPNSVAQWSDQNILVFTTDSTTYTVDGFKAFLSENPATVYFALAEEQDEEITDAALVAQLDALKKAKSYNGTTTISVSGSLAAPLAVEAFKNNWTGTISGINTKLDVAVSGMGDKLEQKPYSFDNVADMQAYNLSVGDMAITAGYYSANDGGAGAYKIISSESSADGGRTIALNNGLKAELIIKDNIVSVKQFGAKGDGTTDDHDAIQSAINSLTFGTVFFPVAKYLVGSSISCNQHVNLRGEFDYRYAGTSEVGICFNNTDGFINGNTIKIDKLIIQNIGNEKTGAGIKGNRLNITDCMVKGFSAGINGNYGQLFINNCYIHGNNHGIHAIVDSRVTNTTLNANALNGINLPAGANDNIIANNKIEWNDGRGIQTYQSSHNVISNNVIDRNAISGIEINSGSSNTVVGNILRRNCINVASTNFRHAQIVLESTNHVVLSANVLEKGNSKDDGSGDAIPQYSLYVMSSSNILSIGNDYLNGGTEASQVNTYNNTENIQFLDSKFDIAKFLKGSAVTSSTIRLGTDATIAVSGTPSTPNTFSQLDKFNYYIRRTDQGAYESGEVCLSNFNVWGSASSTSAKININSFMNGNITATVTFDRETNKYSVTFSTTDSSHEYAARLIPIYV